MTDFMQRPSGDQSCTPIIRASSVEAADFKSKSLYSVSHKTRDYTKQYNSMYFHRLSTLKKRLMPKCQQKWENQTVNDMKAKFVDKILDVQNGQPCWIIGTIFSHLKYKPNILKEVAESTYGALPPAPEAYSDPENDQIMIEDESGRIILAGKLLQNTILISGVIIGLLGAEIQAGVFEAVDICYPTAAPQIPRSPSKKSNKIAIISGLGIDATGSQTSSLELLKEFMVGEIMPDISASISRLVIAGNSITVHHDGSALKSAVSEKDKYKSIDKSNFNVDAVRSLDAFLNQIMLSVPVTLMPGESDPAESTYPQQPLHRSYFPTCKQVIETTHFTRATNPTWLEIDDTRILGTSGENITDMYKYLLPLEKLNKAKREKPEEEKHEELAEPGELVTLCPEDSRMPIIETCLFTQNIVPTAPDTLWCYPFQGSDPFVLEETPHVFFCGNQPQFESKMVHLEDKAVMAVAVPRFDLTGQIVLMDTESLKCEVVQITIADDEDDDMEA